MNGELSSIGKILIYQNERVTPKLMFSLQKKPSG